MRIIPPRSMPDGSPNDCHKWPLSVLCYSCFLPRLRVTLSRVGYTFRGISCETWQKCLELVLFDVFLWYLQTTVSCMLKDYQPRRIPREWYSVESIMERCLHPYHHSHNVLYHSSSQKQPGNMQHFFTTLNSPRRAAFGSGANIFPCAGFLKGWLFGLFRQIAPFLAKTAVLHFIFSGLHLYFFQTVVDVFQK